MASFAPSLPVGTLNVALSNYAKAFRNNALVGDLLAPRVPVARQSYQYVVFDRSNQRLDRQVLRAPANIPQTDRMNYGVAPYFCRSHALRAEIPYEQEQYGLGLGFSTKQAATTRLIDKLSLAREAFIAALVLNAANVSNSVTLAGTSMWDSYLSGGTSHPIQVVEAEKSLIRQAGVDPNLFILSDPVITALINHPDIVERFKYTQPGAITLSQLSSVFGVNCVRAASVQLDKNNVASYVWGVGAVLAYSSTTTSMEDLSALKTFDWAGAPETVGGYGVLEFPKPDLDAKADVVSADWYWDTRITAPETLVSFLNCVSAPTIGAIAAPVVG